MVKYIIGILAIVAYSIEEAIYVVDNFDELPNIDHHEHVDGEMHDNDYEIHHFF